MADPTPPDLDALIDAAIGLLGLEVDESWRASIRTHLKISLDHARNVGDFALDDEIDPAPVYRP